MPSKSVQSGSGPTYATRTATIGAGSGGGGATAPPIIWRGGGHPPNNILSWMKKMHVFPHTAETMSLAPQ